LKPLCGSQQKNIYSPQDAAVLLPFNIEGLKDEKKAIAVGCGIKPSLGKIDVERMTEYVIDEAVRNVVCVGANFEKIFLLDNFCWGDLDKENLSKLFIACEVAKDVAIKYKTPFISGKDSLNNYYLLKNKKISIPPTLLISAIGIIEDVKNIKTSYLKKINNYIYILGKLSFDLGGSVLSECLNLKNLKIPKLNIDSAIKLYKFINKYNRYFYSLHDISDGGLICALAEMCFANKLGVELRLNVKDIFGFLFSEPPACILAEIEHKDKNLFEQVLKKEKIPYLLLGQIKKEPSIIIYNRDKKLLNLDLEEVYKIWSGQIK
jgi:phosphoribosylformylglycinamidine synthase